MIKKLTLIVLALVFVISLSACGEKPVSQTGENIVANGNAYDVKLDERTEETQYEYGIDDVSMVDTTNGKKISLGMSENEINKIIGEPDVKTTDSSTYKGIVIKFREDKAVSMIVSGGKFEGEAGMRFKTSRGVGIGTSFENFKKAYGDSYIESGDTTANDGTVSKTPAKAMRYFEKKGNKLSFLGTELTAEQKSGNITNYYVQDFMFGNESGLVGAIRIGLYSSIIGK